MAPEMIRGIGRELKETAQKTMGEPFTVPIRWIEGERGALRRVLGQAAGSVVSLPFRVAGEIGKGIMRGGFNAAKLALSIPFLPAWRGERQAVHHETQTKLQKLKRADM